MAKVILAQPHNGTVLPGASASFWRASQGAHECLRVLPESSALTYNFNLAWAACLNQLELPEAERPEYFAMIHADVETAPGWLDRMIAELNAGAYDVLSHVIPFRDKSGYTSTGLVVDGRFESGQSGAIVPQPTPKRGRQYRRLMTTQLNGKRLPQTFDFRPLCRLFDVANPVEANAALLVNTGLWVARCGPWMREIRFRVEDTIVRVTDVDDGVEYEPRFWAEDWCFSEDCRALGLRVAATNILPVNHAGATLRHGRLTDDEWHER